MLNAEVEKQMTQLQSEDVGVQGRALAMITVLFSRCENDSQVTDSALTIFQLAPHSGCPLCFCLISAMSAGHSTLPVPAACNSVVWCIRYVETACTHCDTHMLPLCMQ
jgi:hypothetical protein